MDGSIGHLEVYRSGAVKIRLANGILLDVRFENMSVLPFLMLFTRLLQEPSLLSSNKLSLST